jgi:cold shock CspA family protein
MGTGRLKFYNDERGFGLLDDSGGHDIFVHATASAMPE